MKLSILAIAICLTFLVGMSNSVDAQTKEPRVFILNAKRLVANRTKFQDPANKDAELKASIAKIERDAQKELKLEILTVTAKTALPPSGDKHDYVSQAPYFWKDPKSKDGLPYIRRDGEKNPETLNFPDHELFDEMENTVEELATAYFFTGKEEYAARASEVLRAWFLDKKTLMNPNLNFAQAVPGQSSGRSYGIIETREISRVIDAIGLLDGSKSWTQADQKGVGVWFGNYLDWLMTSKNGIEEGKAKNNHGTWYDVQTAAIALFIGKKDIAKQLIESSKKVRIASHIEPDGSQPLELARTRSFNYSTMNLAGMVNLAILGESVGIDLWSYQTSDGRGIRKAIEFLYPFASGEKKWTYKQIIELDGSRVFPIVAIAGRRYRDEKFTAMVNRFPKPAKTDHLLNLAN